MPVLYEVTHKTANIYAVLAICIPRDSIVNAEQSIKQVGVLYQESDQRLEHTDWSLLYNANWSLCMREYSDYHVDSY